MVVSEIGGVFPAILCLAEVAISADEACSIASDHEGDISGRFWFRASFIRRL